MEAAKAVAQGFQVHGVVEESEVLLDLRVAGVVPIDEVGAGKLAEKELEIAIQRQLLEGLAVLSPQLDAPRFGLRQQLLEQIVDPLHERPLFGFALLIQVGADL